MSALHAEIYSASYRNTRSPFPDATDVYIVGALVGDAVIDPQGPNTVPAGASNVVLLVPRGELGPIFVPAVYDLETDSWVKHPDQFAAGGRYVATSDSRFSRLIYKATGQTFYGAVALHDYSMTSEWLANVTKAARETVAQVLA